MDRSLRAAAPATLLLGLVAVIFSMGCDPLTKAEAREALEELEISSQASALTSSSIDIATNFTLGDAAEAALEEVRSFIEAQLPCAELTLADQTLTIEYGAKPGSCTYRGLTYDGTHTITLVSANADEVVLEHTWDAFRNNQVEVSGDATVTWSASDASRHVVYEQTWTRREDGRMGVGTGDVTHTALPSGIDAGFSANGNRQWAGESGEWDLDIQGVEMRWVDAVPQAGAYVLDTPFDKQVTASFERISSTTIEVTLEGPRRSFTFKVATLPDL